MTASHLALLVAMACIIWLLPFTSRLGKAFGSYLYARYFFQKDIYITRKLNGKVISRQIIRKNANGSISYIDLPVIEDEGLT